MPAVSAPKYLADLYRIYESLKLSGRSPRTRALYASELETFRKFLGRRPTVADLQADTVQACVHWIGSRRAPRTANRWRCSIVAIWNWAARRRIVEEFPDVDALKCPKKIPFSWDREQLSAIWRACAETPGTICCVPAGDWWSSLHDVLYDSGERVGAVLQAEWGQVHGDILLVPAEHRKGRNEDRVYHLHRQTLLRLGRIQPYGHGRIFPWSLSYTSLWDHYGRLLERAGLPNERWTKFHAIRRTLATEWHALGRDATALLGHSNPRVTRESYLDTRRISAENPCDVLGRPDGG